MATTKYEMGLIIVLALILCRGGMAQSGCSSILSSLSSCISYVAGNSSKPLPLCCSSLASVVKSQPPCLCPLLTNALVALLALPLTLPAACKVQTPSVSQCDAAADGPAGVPAPSSLSPPADASSESPESPKATTPSSIPPGSKTIPTTSVGTSGGTTATTSIYLRVVTLFVAAWIVNRFY